MLKTIKFAIWQNTLESTITCANSKCEDFNIIFETALAWDEGGVGSPCVDQPVTGSPDSSDLRGSTAAT